MFSPPEQISDLLNSYVNDSISLKEQIADICFHMEGGIEWNSAWGMSFEDREIVVKVINRRLKERNPDSKDYM